MDPKSTSCDDTGDRTGAGRLRRATLGAWAILVVVAVAFAALAVESITNNSVTVDEFAHVPAGVSYWQRGTFSLYRENPPLVRGLIALPVWLAGARTDYHGEGESLFGRPEWSVGKDFERAHTDRYLLLFNRARLVVAALAIACGVLIFAWARTLHGEAAALTCSALWFLDPNVLAHSGIATLDVGTATVGVLATMLYWRFLRRPSWSGAVASGVGLGLAQASKFSMLVLYPAWILMALALRAQRHGASPNRPRPGQIAASFVLSLLVINLCYLFEGSFNQIGSYHFISHLLAGRPSPDRTSAISNNRFRATPLAPIPVPLPKNYVQGFDSEKWDEEAGLLRLEHGRLVVRGTYFSPLVTLGYKLPLGTLLILIASVGWWAAHPRCPDESGWVAAIPGLSLIAMLCGQTGLNWAIRYALPALPYLFVGAGGFIRAAWGCRAGRLVLAVCLLWNVITLASIRPHYLSFGNELVGGPSGAMREFIGSNYDWGQDLIRLKRWCDAHPEASPMVLAYYGTMDPRTVGLLPSGLPDELLQAADHPGEADPPNRRNRYYCAVSASCLSGLPGVMTDETGRRVFARFRLPPWVDSERPYAKVGYSIRIYRIEPPS
jgi:hypothetical protein